jgi:hypothetical protein
MMEDLARALVVSRVQEAEGLRGGRRHAAARRLGRRAEAAAGRAALALSRTL